MSENIKLKFAAHHLPRAAIFMAQKDIRYYLNGVHVERCESGGVYIVGCDGHTMTIIHDKDGMIEGVDSVIIKATHGLVAACKKAKQKIATKYVLAVGSRLSVACDFNQEQTSLEEFVQAGNPWVEGQYPNWRKVVPDFNNLKPGILSPCINSSYLARFSKLYKSRMGDNGISFWQATETGAIVVQHLNIPEMISIVMPIRDDGGESLRSRFNQFDLKKSEEAA